MVTSAAVDEPPAPRRCGALGRPVQASRRSASLGVRPIAASAVGGWPRLSSPWSLRKVAVFCARPPSVWRESCPGEFGLCSMGVFSRWPPPSASSLCSPPEPWPHAPARASDRAALIFARVSALNGGRFLPNRAALCFARVSTEYTLPRLAAASSGPSTALSSARCASGGKQGLPTSPAKPPSLPRN
jgi:hypothetical protein